MAGLNNGGWGSQQAMYLQMSPSKKNVHTVCPMFLLIFHIMSITNPCKIKDLSADRIKRQT
jgi:hypothetical protein